MINIVLAETIISLSETKTRFERVKKKVSNWKAVIVFSILAMTLKVASEQLIMLVKSAQN